MIETDEKLLLDLLNTTPVVNGTPRDELSDIEAGLRWLTAHSQPASADEWRALLDVRTVLQDIVRGNADPAAAAPFVLDVSSRAAFVDGGIVWAPELPDGRTAAAQAVLAWNELAQSSPGRLRPCANPECQLFLIDHSKPNSARWCSMAVCGNRMKARRHYQRTRSTQGE
jgi:predicted RNA-binding Zn ribbon-like protein